MGLSTLVKVGNISNLSDARYCAGMGVTILGFNIDAEYKDYVDPTTYAAIKGWVEGVQFAVESKSDTTINFGEYEFDFFQTESPDQIEPLSEMGLKIIFNLNLDDPEASQKINTLKTHKNSIDFLQLESANNKIDDQIITELNKDFQVLLGFGIDSSNLPLIEKMEVTGIALKGSEEIEPGFKDYDELADILEGLEIE